MFSLSSPTLFALMMTAMTQATRAPSAFVLVDGIDEWRWGIWRCHWLNMISFDVIFEVLIIAQCCAHASSFVAAVCLCLPFLFAVLCLSSAFLVFCFVSILLITLLRPECFHCELFSRVLSSEAQVKDPAPGTITKLGVCSCVFYLSDILLVVGFFFGSLRHCCPKSLQSRFLPSLLVLCATLSPQPSGALSWFLLCLFLILWVIITQKISTRLCLVEEIRWLPA